MPTIEERLHAAEAECERLRAVVELAERAILHSDRLSDASGQEGIVIYSMDAKPLRDALAALAAPPDQPTAEKIDSIPSHTSPPTDGIVYIQIDRLNYQTKVGTYSGKGVRAFAHPPIDDRLDLWLIRPGDHDRLIQNGDRVDIRTSGLRFFTTPKVINAGAPPDQPTVHTRHSMTADGQTFCVVDPPDPVLPSDSQGGG